MRIRRSQPSSVSLFPSPSHSPSSCSSSSSCFSSSTHSTISTHSLSSSSNSTSSSPSRRCHGLDLLVKAVYHVAGSVVGVPYIQRRVIRRRKRAVRFNNFIINWVKDEHENDVNDDNDEESEVFDCNLDDEMKKQTKRSMALPSKYQDSVLQSWKPRNNRRIKRSTKV